MSTAYAFAAVSAVIRGRLAAYLTASGVSSAVGGLTFTALPPDRVPTGAQEKNGVNIFLYRISRNQGWATIGPPTRNAGGNAVAAPRSRPRGVPRQHRTAGAMSERVLERATQQAQTSAHWCTSTGLRVSDRSMVHQ